jgi:hypothetical protein
MDIAGCSQKITIIPFDDVRKDKTLGKTPASTLEATSSVAEWMQNALVKELEKAGCYVLVSNAIPESGLAVKGYVQEVYLEQPALASFRAHTLVRLDIHKDGRLAYINTYKGSERLHGATTNREQALTEELQSLMSVVVPELVDYAG